MLFAQPIGCAKDTEFSVDRAVGQARGLPMLNVRRQDSATDRIGPSAGEELQQRREPRLDFP